MPSLELLIRKYGPKSGREKYNAYHREYRRTHKRKMIKYWRSRRKAEKANTDVVSSAQKLSPA